MLVDLDTSHIFVEMGVLNQLPGACKVSKNTPARGYDSKTGTRSIQACKFAAESYCEGIAVQIHEWSLGSFEWKAYWVSIVYLTIS